ncbi:DUF6531 domain-containing protein [Flavobacterium sp. EDS]|uniref:DUF6531 domain-containing protein n=1 Tax=Flavobacterium sp. EDS TaxID=2897328 RepID=UPI001E54071D|nr:DUF6531 domain-containing protein [Flavobacterium sp. EDS]MCD0476268.1 DUF6531 domain-containing protein [Flavobacterium sp. EDS]
MEKESKYADKSYHEKVSQQLAITTAKKTQGISANVTTAQKTYNNKSLSTSTKVTALALNAVGTGIQAFGAVTSMVDGVLGAALMPMLEGIGMKGMASLPISKQLDPVLGIDIHMVTIPPSPAPISMPHPYIGMLFRPKDFLAAAIASIIPPPPAPPPMSETPTDGEQAEANKVQALTVAHTAATMIVGMIGATVKIGGFIPRAVASTPTKNIPHFPMGAGFHPVYSRLCSKNNGHALFGSLLALADGDPIGGGGAHLHNSCQDIGIFSPHTFRPTKNKDDSIKIGLKLFLPTSVIIPIPTSGLIITNPVPAPFNPITMLKKMLRATLGKFVGGKMHKLVNKKIGSGKLQNMLHKGICTVTGHPVDVATGNFFTDEEDFFLPGPIPLSWERTYYSKSDYQGPLGNGWHHAYDMAMHVDDDTNTVTVRLTDGRPIAFEKPSLKKPTFNKAEQLELFVDDTNRLYLWDIKENLYYYFTPNSYNDLHLLQTVANANGFALFFGYDTNGFLIKITDAAHRELTVTNDNQGRILTITAPHPTAYNQFFAIATYEYDAIGNLVKQTNAENDSMFFEYKDRLMTKEIWRNGLNWYFEYDGTAPGARCVHTWGDGDIYNHKLFFEEGKTIVTDSRGHDIEYYHKNGLVYKRIDPNGAINQWLYDKDNQLLSETDPLENAYLYGYDNRGNQIQTTNPMGGTETTDYSFLHKNLPSLLETSLGGKWKWKYDSNGNTIEVTNPNNAKTKIEYQNGLPNTIIDYLGNKTLLEYDKNYNLIQITEPTGAITLYSYDSLGRNITTQNAKDAKQKLFYDLLGRVTQVDDFDGNEIKLQYDGIDNLLQYNDAQTEVSYTYKGMWKMTGRYQNQKKTLFFYNKEEQLIRIENDHQPYTFKRDSVGNVVEESPFDNVVRLYKHDLAGNVLQKEIENHESTLAQNAKTNYEYNRLGNIQKITYTDGIEHLFDYNPAGLLISAINPASEVTFTYDTLGNITQETQNGTIITNTYNAVGQRTNLKSNLGANLDLEYNELGQLSKMKTQEDWQSTFGYDQMGLEIQRLLPGNIQQTTNRDALGRPTEQLVGHASKRVKSRKYQWGINNQLRQIIDSTTGVTNFAYNKNGHLTEAKYADGSIQNRYPDGKGNLYETPEKKDRTYTRDGKLEKKGSWHYKYDHLGNLIEKYKKTGSIFSFKEEHWFYEWNATGMLKRVQRPDGDYVNFAYDALGRRIYKHYKKTFTNFAWDGNVPLHEWKTFTTKDVLSDNIITWVFEEDSFSPIAKIKKDKQYSIINDHLGTPIEAYADDGKLIWERSLNSNGKVLKETGFENFCQFLYQGQSYDSEIELAYNRFRYYDPEEGRYISQDPIGLASGEFGFYNYVHDTNGWIDELGLASNAYKAAWTKARKKYWSDELEANPGRFSERNKQRIREGNSPQIKVIVEDKLGNRSTKYVSMELEHTHLKQRGGSLKAHESWNLTEANPWGHASMDKYRHVGTKLIKILEGLNPK